MAKATNAKRWQDGMYRIVRDGVPTYVAPWVKDLTPAGKSLLCRGGFNPGVKAADQAARHPQTRYLPAEA